MAKDKDSKKQENREKRSGIQEILVGGAADAVNPELEEIARICLDLVGNNPAIVAFLNSRMFGILAGIIEREGGSSASMIIRVLSEKTSDFMEMLGTLAKYEKAAPGSSEEAKAVQSLADSMKKFFDEATKCVAEAKDPEVEFARVTNEYEIRKRIIAFLEEQARKNAAATTPPATTLGAEVEHKFEDIWKKLSEDFNKLGAKLRNDVLPKLNEKRHAADHHLAEKIRNFSNSQTWLIRR